MTTKRQGDAAETTALKHLMKAGMKLVETNYRTPGRGGGGLDQGDAFDGALRLAAGAATANALVPAAGFFAAEDAVLIATQVVVTTG